MFFYCFCFSMLLSLPIFIFYVCWLWDYKDFFQSISWMKPFQENPTLRLPLNRLQSKAGECARLSQLNSWRYSNQFTLLPLDLTWPSASESLTWLGSICVWFKSGSKIGAQRRDASRRRGRILGQTTWKYSLKGAVCPWICPLLLLLRLLKGFKSLKMTRRLMQVKRVVTFVAYYDRNTPKTLINRDPC